MRQLPHGGSRRPRPALGRQLGRRRLPGLRRPLRHHRRHHRASPGVPLRGRRGQLPVVHGLRHPAAGHRAPYAVASTPATRPTSSGTAARTRVPRSDHRRHAAARERRARKPAAGPPASSVEMGHVGRDWNDIAARVASCSPLAQSSLVPTPLASWIGGRTLPRLFAEAFGSPAVTPARIIMAIATYERTLWSGQAHRLGRRGHRGAAPTRPPDATCSSGSAAWSCHAGNQFTDNIYHYIGVRPAAEGLGPLPDRAQPGLIGSFKTPSLRNVGLRPALMHHGQFHSLRDVVEFYHRGGDFSLAQQGARHRAAQPHRAAEDPSSSRSSIARSPTCASPREASRSIAVALQRDHARPEGDRWRIVRQRWRHPAAGRGRGLP